MSHDLSHDLKIYTSVLKGVGVHQASGTMKTNERSKQVRVKVVEKYRSGVVYKKISETLKIPRRTIKSVIKKLKEYGTTINLPREGRPPKLTDQARRALIRGNKETKDNPEGAAKRHREDWSLSIGPL